MDPIQAAIEAYEAQGLEGQYSVQEVANQHGVWRSTMQRRMDGQSVPRSDYVSNSHKLSPQQEVELVEYIESLTARRLPPTRAMVQIFASEIAHNQVSERWVSRFLIRKQDHLTYRWTDAMDRERHQADSGQRYNHFFEELYDQIVRHEIEPRHSYNMDEKGFLLGCIGKSKRLFSRTLWEQGGIKTNMQDGNREWITTVACICADGTALPPVIIFASNNSTLQSTWVKDIGAGNHSVHVGSSPTGWSNDEMGLDWLKNVFDRYTKDKARHSWRMLILDGHGSHLTSSFIAYCFENKILLIIYPPHATHTLQPLDVVMFRSLSSHYKEGLSTRVQDSQGLLPVKKMDFFSLFWTAWTSSFTQDHILQAFKSCGVWPIDPDPVL
jgi:transposase-like protein